MAVIIGALIVIGLGLSMSAAMLRWLGIELHFWARLVAPLLLALLETILFLAFVPSSDLLPENGGWPMTAGLITAAWLINGAVSGLYWFQQRPAKAEVAPE